MCISGRLSDLKILNKLFGSAAIIDIIKLKECVNKFQ